MKIATYFTDPTPQFPNGEQPLFLRNTNSATGTVNLVDADGVLVIGKCPVSQERGVRGTCVIGPESTVDIEARSLLVDAKSRAQAANDKPGLNIADAKKAAKDLMDAETALEAFDKKAAAVKPEPK